MNLIRALRVQLATLKFMNDSNASPLEMRPIISRMVSLLDEHVNPDMVRHTETAHGAPLVPTHTTTPVTLQRLTTDPTDLRLTHGTGTHPTPQAEAYLVLSQEEIDKGFVRPYRDSYRHVGPQPRYALRDLTDEEKLDPHRQNYAKFETYPGSDAPCTGRYWTQEQLDNKGCFGVTTMNSSISATYARNPKFYGGTYCTRCAKHLPVEEFVWLEANGTMGPELGS